MSLWQQCKYNNMRLFACISNQVRQLDLYGDIGRLKDKSRVAINGMQIYCSLGVADRSFSPVALFNLDQAAS